MTESLELLTKLEQKLTKEIKEQKLLLMKITDTELTKYLTVVIGLENELLAETTHQRKWAEKQQTHVIINNDKPPTIRELLHEDTDKSETQQVKELLINDEKSIQQQVKDLEAKTENHQ